MNARRTSVALAVAVAIALGTGACSKTGTKAEQPYMDAPKSGQIDKKPMDIIEMSDGFSNVGAKCHGADGIYVLFHNNDKYGAMSVVPNDPNCTGR